MIDKLHKKKLTRIVWFNDNNAKNYNYELFDTEIFNKIEKNDELIKGNLSKIIIQSEPKTSRSLLDLINNVNSEFVLCLIDEETSYDKMVTNKIYGVSNIKRIPILFQHSKSSYSQYRGNSFFQDITNKKTYLLNRNNNILNNKFLQGGINSKFSYEIRPSFDDFPFKKENTLPGYDILHFPYYDFDGTCEDLTRFLKKNKYEFEE